MVMYVSKLNYFYVYLVIERTVLLLNKKEISTSYNKNHIKKWMETMLAILAFADTG